MEKLQYFPNLNLRVKACDFCAHVRNKGVVKRKGDELYCYYHKTWVNKHNGCTNWYLDREGYTPFG